MSSDRLFRVRGKQPYSTDLQQKTSILPVLHPTISDSVQVGEFCVFNTSKTDWKIGKVLKFSNHLEKTKGSQQYNSLTASVKSQKLGVSCTWFSSTTEDSPNKFSLVPHESAHQFISITSYVCTLSYSCFEKIEGTKECDIPTSLVTAETEKVVLATEQHLSVNATIVSEIDKLSKHVQTCLPSLAPSTVPSKSKPSSSSNAADNVGSQSCTSDYWVKWDAITLNRKDMQDILVGKQLFDLHVTAFQNIVKKHFPDVGGLQNPLMQNKIPLSHKQSSVQSLQIIHIRGSHWATLQLKDNGIYLYDSMYTSVSDDTFEVIAQLVRTKKSSVRIVNIAKQGGATDCGLYAMATVVCLVTGVDPGTVGYNQAEMRSHLAKTLETGILTPFPVIKCRRPVDRVVKTMECLVYFSCRLPDMGEKMVSCDQCDEWFHLSCISNSTMIASKSWFCSKCKSNAYN